MKQSAQHRLLISKLLVWWKGGNDLLTLVFLCFSILWLFMYVDSLPTACSCWWWWFRGFFLPFYCHLERRGVKTWLTWHFQSTYQKFLRWKTNQPFLTWRFYLFFFSTPSLLPHFNCSRGSDMCICTEEEMEERERERWEECLYTGAYEFSFAPRSEFSVHTQPQQPAVESAV